MNLCKCGCGAEVNNEYKKGHWGKGKKYSPERCAAVRAALQIYYTPEVRQEYANRMRKNMKLCWDDPGYRERKSAWIKKLDKKQWQDPEFRQKQADGVAASWNKPGVKDRRTVEMSKRMILKWGEDSYRLLKSEQGKMQWKNLDDAAKEKWLKKILTLPKPNKTEQMLADLISDNSLPFKYVGDGQFILGGKVPDFLNINGRKQVLELYGDYWHAGEDPQDRIDYFKEYGFDCLVIWEHELKDKDAVIDKIKEFSLPLMA